MKLEFRLIDDKQNALGGAMLFLFLYSKTEHERNLGPAVVNARGEVRLEDVDPAYFKLVDFNKSSYVISYRGKKTDHLPLGKPERIADGNYRFVLTFAGEFSPIGETPDADNGPQK